MATDVFYNGVWLRNCLTKQFDQEVVYDDSNTDRICCRFTITVEAIVAEDLNANWTNNPQTGQITGVSPVPVYNIGYCAGTHFDTSSAYYKNNQNYTDQFTGAIVNSGTDKMQIVHQLLSVPRGHFQYSNDKLIMMDVWPSGSFINGVKSPAGPNTPGLGGGGDPLKDYETHREDVSNGPKPKFVNINQIFGHRAYRISFSIEISITLCDPTLADDTAQIFKDNNTFCGTRIFDNAALREENRRLLSNRFSIEETRDENFYNTRTMTGKARVRSIKDWHQSIRWLVLPMLPRGYQRVSQQFITSTDGLELTYRVVDRQRYAAPPYPATSFTGAHLEKTGMDGIHSQGMINLTMQGGPSSSKKGLLAAGISIVEARIGKTEAGKAETSEHCIVREVSITDILHENQIQMTVQFHRHVPEDKKNGPGFGWANVFWNKLGVLPDVDTLLNNGPGNNRVDGQQYNRDQWPIPVPWDSGAPYGIFAQYLQDGCCPWHMTLSNFYEPPASYPDDDDKEEDNPNPPRESRAYIGDPVHQDIRPQNDAQYQPYDQGHVNYPYTYYEVSHDYPVNKGLVALPLAAFNIASNVYRPGGPRVEVPQASDANRGSCVITSLKAPVCCRVVFVSAKRVGKAPVLPKIQNQYTDENGIVYFLQEYHPEFKPAHLMADGKNYEYEIFFRLVWLMSRPITDSDIVTFGVLPWAQGNKFQTVADLSAYNQDERLI